MAGRPFLTAKSTISCPTEYDVSMSTMVFDRRRGGEAIRRAAICSETRRESNVSANRTWGFLFFTRHLQDAPMVGTSLRAICAIAAGRGSRGAGRGRSGAVAGRGGAERTDGRPLHPSSGSPCSSIHLTAAGKPSRALAAIPHERGLGHGGNAVAALVAHRHVVSRHDVAPPRRPASKARASSHRASDAQAVAIAHAQVVATARWRRQPPPASRTEARTPRNRRDSKAPRHGGNHRGNPRNDNRPTAAYRPDAPRFARAAPPFAKHRRTPGRLVIWIRPRVRTCADTRKILQIRHLHGIRQRRGIVDGKRVEQLRRRRTVFLQTRQPARQNGGQTRVSARTARTIRRSSSSSLITRPCFEAMFTRA